MACGDWNRKYFKKTLNNIELPPYFNENIATIQKEHLDLYKKLSSGEYYLPLPKCFDDSCEKCKKYKNYAKMFERLIELDHIIIREILDHLILLKKESHSLKTRGHYNT